MTPPLARACRCTYPIACREPGEPAGCLKCGHRLSAPSPCALDARAGVGEAGSGVPPLEGHPPSAKPPAHGSPEPQRRDHCLGQAPVAAGDPSLPPPAPERGSGQTVDWPFSPAPTREPHSPEAA